MSVFNRSASKIGSGPDGDKHAVTVDSQVIELLTSINDKLETLLDYQALVTDDDNPPTREMNL